MELFDQGREVTVQKHPDQLPQREGDSLAKRLMAIGRDAAPRFKEPLKSTEIGDLLYDENGLPR